MGRVVPVKAEKTEEAPVVNGGVPTWKKEKSGAAEVPVKTEKTEKVGEQVPAFLNVGMWLGILSRF